MSCILHLFSRFVAGVDGEKREMYVLCGAGGLVHSFPDKCSQKITPSFVKSQGLLLRSHQQANWAAQRTSFTRSNAGSSRYMFNTV